MICGRRLQTLALLSSCIHAVSLKAPSKARLVSTPQCQTLDIGTVCAEVVLGSVVVTVDLTSPRCFIEGLHLDERSLQDARFGRISDVNSTNQKIFKKSVGLVDSACSSVDDGVVLAGYSTFVCNGSNSNETQLRTGRGLQNKALERVRVEVPFKLRLPCMLRPSLPSKPHPQPYCATAWAWTAASDCKHEHGEYVKCASCQNAADSFPALKADKPKLSFLNEPTSVATLGPFNFHDLEPRNFTFFIEVDGCDMRRSEAVATVSVEYVETKDLPSGSRINRDFVLVTVHEMEPHWELESFHLHIGLNTPFKTGLRGTKDKERKFQDAYDPEKFPVGHAFNYGDDTVKDSLVIETKRFPREPAYVLITGTVCKHVN